MLSLSISLPVKMMMRRSIVRHFAGGRMHLPPDQRMHYPEKRLIGVELTQHTRRNVRTSPFRLNLIAGLVRRMWIPEALTQLQFLNKRFAPVVAQALEYASKKAGTEHELLPEELEVERCFVTPAAMVKSLKIHAKGRTGIKKKRSGHLNVTLAKVNFDERIASATNQRQRAKWELRKSVAQKARLDVLGERFANERMFPPRVKKEKKKKRRNLPFLRRDEEDDEDDY